MTEKEELEIIKISRKQSVFKNAENDIVDTRQGWNLILDDCATTWEDFNFKEVKWDYKNHCWKEK